MTKTVLDASVILALLTKEIDSSTIIDEITNALISTVNYSETIAKLFEWGMSEAEVNEALEFDLKIKIFDADQAYLAGQLRPMTKKYGLSFGDRACLALAISNEAIALTADRSWKNLDIDGLKVKLVR